MTRADRLYAITGYLRSRRRAVSVGELAERFGVTRRTIYRDLATLRDGYVPIVGRPGRGGGLRIDAEYSLPPLNLTAAEAEAAWLTIRLATLDVELPWSRPARAALEKILGALPGVRQRDLLGLTERIIVGSPASEPVAASVAPVRAGVFAQCRRAFAELRVLEIDYHAMTDVRTTRKVEPHGLLVQSPAWYLLARDRLRDAPRMFRLDRIEAARLPPREEFVPVDPRTLFEEIGTHNLEAPELAPGV
jgi:predicted DNA-binding transcriptional regulator YafY